MGAVAVFKFDDMRDLISQSKQGKREITKSDSKQLKDTIRKDMESGLDELEKPAGVDLYQLRNGYVERDELDGNILETQVSGKNVDSDGFFNQRYGLENFNELLYLGFGVRVDKIKYSQMCNYFGTSISSANFSTPTSTESVIGHRWLVPEVVLNAVMRGWKKGSRVNTWVGNTINSSQPDGIFIPQIKIEDFDATELQEFESLDMGVHEFKAKKAKVKKYGKGVAITDEVQDRCTIDIMQNALMAIGSKFALKEEKLAIKAMEQDIFATDGTAESTAVVGTQNGTSFQEKDILMAIQALSALGYDVTTMISTLSNIVDIQLLNIFRGYNGNKMEGSMTINDNANVLKNNIASFTRKLSSSNKLLLFDSNQFLSRVLYKSMRVENERNSKNGGNSLYVRMHSGFVISNIQAGIILDKSTSISSTPYASNYLAEEYIDVQ